MRRGVATALFALACFTGLAALAELRMVGAANSKVFVPVAFRTVAFDASPGIQPTAAATATTGATTPTSAATAVPTATATTAGSSILTSWMINSTGVKSAIYTSSDINVQSVTQVTQNGEQYVQMRSTGLPNYTSVMAAATVTALRARPNASSDFRSGGGPSVSAGQTVNFGQDIGYRSQGCASTSTTGYGYWPPGPACAAAQSHAVFFPLNPSPATTTTNVGPKLGYAINGVPIYNWGDAQSYNNSGVWFRTAADWERYDMDIDNGHASPAREYHHHFYPATFARQLGDIGSGHSPLYGFAADGYPIRGPWTAPGTLARSSWAKRDYDTSGSTTGCGTVRVRSCLLVDQADISRGTTTASSSGPRTDQAIMTGNSNSVLAVSGVFAQDYYLDTRCSGCLDRHNGHDHDGLGYHYHLTVTQALDGSLTPAYPYTAGPTYYGRIHSNSFGRPMQQLRQAGWAPRP